MRLATWPLDRGWRRCRCLRGFAIFRRDRRAVAAVELALLAPLVITASFGVLAVPQGVRAYGLLSSTASSVADMVALQNTNVTPLTQAMIRDMCTGSSSGLGTGGAQVMLRPNPPDTLAMSIASYSKQPGGVTQDWEYDGACPTKGASLAGATGIALATPLLQAAGDSVIIVRATYSYTSLYVTLMPNLTLSQTASQRPRYGKITLSGLLMNVGEPLHA